MKKQSFFSGKQIKNYLIGFGSIFSDIPYINSRGIIKNVPIHYGSPSDVISYLETNVDNESTKNVNRLKDLTIPMFSFRLSTLERNLEKRRDPLSTRTRDLRKVGYNTGYTTMTPAPITIGFELVLWASSDYQCFEILEQIIPYFNSPQQIIIEQLPDSQAKTSEVTFTSMDIDTEPSSRKFSAQATLQFNMSAWLYTQPKIWTTNMQFELSILDENYETINTTSDKFNRPVEFIEPETKSKIISMNDKIKTLYDFILIHKLECYKLDYYIFEYMIKNNIIDEQKKIINSDDFIFITHENGNDVDMLITEFKMKKVILNIENLEDAMHNEILKNYLKQNDADGIIAGLKMFNIADNDIKKIIILLDANLISKNYNIIGALTPSDKLSLFGEFSYNPQYTLQNIQQMISMLQFIKLNYYNFNLPDNDEIYNFIHEIPFTIINKYAISYIFDEFYNNDDKKENLKILINKYNTTEIEYNTYVKTIRTIITNIIGETNENQ